MQRLKVNARDDKGRPICGAKTKKDGEPCQNSPMRNGRCRLHGGKSLIGPMSPAWKDGRYSAYLPKDVLGKYERLRSDPEYLKLQDEIALVDTRIGALLSGIEFKGSGEQIRRLQVEFDRMRLGLKNQNATQANLAVLAMEAIFSEAIREGLAWDEIARLIELRRRLSETEQARVVKAQAIITATDLQVFMGRLSGVLRTYINDPEILAGLASELRVLTHAITE